MDSVSHVRVAHLLLDYVEQTCGVTFDQSGFVYGNLKPDLTGTYLTKRHNPSIMMDEVMEKIRAFTRKYTIARSTAGSCRSISARSAIISPTFSPIRITTISMTTTCSRIICMRSAWRWSSAAA